MLDAEVQRLVMEIVWDESRCRVCGWPLSDEHCRPNDDCSMRPLPERRADAPPPYSTDIAAAFSVLMNLGARGWKWDAQNRYPGCWACHVHFPAPDYRNVFEPADSMPLAICLAALAAVEEK